MNCDECLNQLEEYIDGEVVEREAEQISAHLITCARCSNEFEALTAEQEIYARYDRELEVSPAMWNAIAARTAAESRAADAGSRARLREWLAGLFAAPRLGYALTGALAVLIIAVVFGIYLRTQQQTPKEIVARGVEPVVPAGKKARELPQPPPSSSPVEGYVSKKTPKHSGRSIKVDDPGVLDVPYSELTERDTAEHIQQAENLLRSIRSLQASDDDSEIDVSYEKAMSQRLLNENVVLRRDAERAGKFPTKELLGELEPFLMDIANLPDKTTPDKLRAIKDRAQKTEIVAALVGY
jgi:Putative zinc-finger